MSCTRMLHNGLAPLLASKMLRSSPIHADMKTKPAISFVEKKSCTKRTTLSFSHTSINTRAKKVSALKLSRQTFDELTAKLPTIAVSNHIVVTLDFKTISPILLNKILGPVDAATMTSPYIKSISEEEILETSPEQSCKHSLESIEHHCTSRDQEKLMLEDPTKNGSSSEDGCRFRKFSELPLEVQCMIWDFSMEEDRIIEVHITKRCANWMIVYASTDAKNPAILSICQVARERGLKRYSPLSVANSWKRDKKMYDDRQALLGLPLDFVGPEAATTNFKCYINFDRDTVFINSSHFRIYSDALEVGDNTWREDFGYQFLKDLFFSTAGDRLQKLAVDYLLAEKWFNNDRNNWQYCQVLAAMPKLQQLAIVWTGHHHFQRVIQNECCRTTQIEILTNEALSDEIRYSAKFPSGHHHRILKFHKMKGLGPYLGEGWISDRFASGETSITWKSNIVTAIQENRPVNPANYPPNSFHFTAEGKSRYRDLCQLKLTEVAAEREC
ncbi:uncharacterized protein EAF01_005008 [Botrytis porri]|uniref:2EXR domain-containing protein n=1 Tax=Botrytis porri TaxID=87229 RepID=A0A4Z1L6E8_9HELO|nr:uncharacterized protein EAF01_005008 [Botrytis porri]KAF7907422.1 hypothetical protein EAF01_005008 [Botrytis porri]TGO92424.1 hypothetical protein BPOR_0003g00220 [Botrytis porri]